MYSARNGTEITYRMDRAPLDYKSDDPNEHIFALGAPTIVGNLQNVRSAPITDPLSRGLGIPDRSPEPLVQWASRDHPFPIFAGSPWRERDVAHRIRHG